MTAGSRRQAYSGRVALVTGAASGIGRAVAIALAERGARVIAADRDEAVLDGIGAVHRLDVTDAAACVELVRGTAETHGRLDLLFHFAGVAVWAEARDTEDADWRALVDVNLHGTVHMVHAAYPTMVAQGDGHLVLAGSLAGLGPSPGMAAYAAVKHGVVGLATSLRAEGAGLGVRVSVVCPGPVSTPLLGRSPVRRFDRRSLEAQMARRGQTSEQCAGGVLRGVERNRAVIVPSLAARLAWYGSRLSPAVTLALTERRIRRLREMAL